MRGLILALLLVGCAHAASAPSGMVTGEGMPARLYCVERNDRGLCDIYRSAQPTPPQFEALVSRLGIASVIKLNGELPFDGGADVVPTGVLLIRDAWLPAEPVTRAQTDEATEDIRAAPRPVLVHCTDGIERTGLLVALYRVGRGSLAWAAWQEWHAYGHGDAFPMLDEAFEDATGFRP